mmetsp:Transcript_132579/g.369624  ORF Transcript_132579/g.369624 Transcript_132579/m.369624 type:complete len:460 (-) Transcript_132579:174-1553(-)
MLRLDIVSARLSWCWVLLSPITLSCSLRLFVSFLYSSAFLSMMAWSSSRRSRKPLHCSDMVSCKRPQFGLPSVHFFHCPSAGASTTGSGSGVTMGIIGVVDDTFGSLRCSNRSAVPRGACVCAMPKASRMASRAVGVSIFSSFACARASPKRSSRPELVLQTLRSGSLPCRGCCCGRLPGAAPSCKPKRGAGVAAASGVSSAGAASSSLHLVRARMKSKTARSFFRTVIVASFSSLVVWYSWETCSNSSSTAVRRRSCSAMPPVALTFFRSRSAIWEPKRARSVVTCEKVSRFLSSNSLHSMTTASRSFQADSIILLRIFRAFCSESSSNSPLAFLPPDTAFLVPAKRTSDCTSSGNLPSKRSTASLTSILSCATWMMWLSVALPARNFMTIDSMDASRLWVTPLLPVSIPITREPMVASKEALLWDFPAIPTSLPAVFHSDRPASSCTASPSCSLESR